MRLIRIVGVTISLILIFITGIVVGRFLANKNDPNGDLSIPEGNVSQGKPETKEEESESEEVFDEEAERRLAEEAAGHKLPGENDYVFHEAAVNDGNFYAIQTADSIDLTSDADLGSRYAILINADDWTVVAYKDPYTRIVPASMTKVLTVLTAAEHMSAESLEDHTTIDYEVTDYLLANDCSAAGILPAEQVPVKDLFYCTILPSGADGALALANYVAGDQESFMDLMNQKLKDLDLDSSAHFTNCIGLFGEDHYCTVYDMAIIMQAALQNEIARDSLTAHQYTTTVTKEHPTGIELSNLFLRRIEDQEFGGQILGAKTGFVNQSGNCAVSSEVSDKGTTYICVTVGAEGAWNCIYDHQYLYRTYATE